MIVRALLCTLVAVAAAACAPREPVPESALGAPSALVGGDRFFVVGPTKVGDLVVNVTAQGSKQGVVKVDGTTSAARARATGLDFVNRRICGPAGKSARVKPGKTEAFRPSGQWVVTYVCA